MCGTSGSRDDSKPSPVPWETIPGEKKEVGWNSDGRQAWYGLQLPIQVNKMMNTFDDYV